MANVAEDRELRTVVLEQREDCAGERVDSLLSKGADCYGSADEVQQAIVKLKEAGHFYERCSGKLAERYQQIRNLGKNETLRETRRRRRFEVYDLVNALRASQPVLDDVSSFDLGSIKEQRTRKYVDDVAATSLTHETLPLFDSECISSSVSDRAVPAYSGSNFQSVANPSFESGATASAYTSSVYQPVTKSLFVSDAAAPSTYLSSRYQPVTDPSSVSGPAASACTSSLFCPVANPLTVRGSAAPSYSLPLSNPVSTSLPVFRSATSAVPDFKITTPGATVNTAYPFVRLSTQVSTSQMFARPRMTRTTSWAELSESRVPRRPPSPSSSRSMNLQVTNTSLISELNKLNISPFSGKPSGYWSWRTRVQQKLSSVSLSPLYKLLLIKENCTGPPREMIEEHMLATGEVSDADVDMVWSLLQERYGSSAQITRELFERIRAFPTISGDNIGVQMLKLFDLCRILLFNQQYNPQMLLLDHAGGLEVIRQKLPQSVQEQWREFGQRFKFGNNGLHPPFNKFTEFLHGVANSWADTEFAVVTSPKRTNGRVLKTSHDVSHEEKPTCQHHDHQGHSLASCKAFGRLPYQERREKIQQWRLCYRCLSSGHMARSCSSEVKCDLCNSNSHPSNLHPPPREPEQQSNPRDGQTLCTRLCGNSQTLKNCSKTVLVDITLDGVSNKTLRAYAIIDDQSNKSLVDQQVVDFFGKKFPDHEYTLNFASQRYKMTERGCLVEGLRVTSVTPERRTIELPEVISTREIADTRDEVADPSIVRAHKHIRYLAKHFSDVDKDAKVMLLIGRDVGEAMHSQCYSQREPYAYKTPLGWALVGRTCEGDTLSESGREHKVLCSHVSYSGTIPKPFESDPFLTSRDDEEPGLSRDDSEFLRIMSGGVCTDEHGSLQLPLPIRSSLKLPDNKSVVKHRTTTTVRRLKTDEGRLQSCLDSISKDLLNGFIEEVPRSQIYPTFPVWHLPVFPVFNKKNKTRLVFDASAKYRGISLNDVLYQGPDLNNTLRGVLLRFREGPVGFMSDIASMFNAFALPLEQRDLYRFFWFKNNLPDEELVVYRSRVHLFGSRASPAIATYGLKYAATHQPAPLTPEVKSFLQRNFYVDDGIASADSTEQAISILQGAKQALAQYNIKLHKILCSSEEVLQHFPAEDTANGIHNLETKDGSQTRTLGVEWDPKQDCFRVNLLPPEKPFTKRGMLAVVNSIYDPLGIVSPVVLTGRLIMRAVLPRKGSPDYLQNLDWDDPLPAGYLEEWKLWVSSLRDIALLEVPRSFVGPEFAFSTQELHIYSDASQEAIGYVVYVRSAGADDVLVRLVEANSRVAPRAATTIPRLELCAAVQACLAAHRIVTELVRTPDRIYYYTDSKIVLGYLRNQHSRFSRYVSRRTETVLRYSNLSQWHYVPTAVNPADLASRPTKPKDLLQSLWTRGPDRLWNQILEYEGDEDHAHPGVLPETMEAEEHLVLRTKMGEPSIYMQLCEKISTLDRIINVVIMMKLLCNKLDSARQRLGVLLAPRRAFFPRQAALNILILHAQRDVYRGDFLLLNQGTSLPGSSCVASLAPFLDEDGLIRVGGRVRRADLPYGDRHPVLLPPKHRLTYLILMHHHVGLYHQGRVLTQSAVRQAGYHIQKGSQAVRRLIDQCRSCRRLRGETLNQQMSDLPTERLENVPPFTNIGMDLFGPFTVYDGLNSTRRRSSTKKVWVLIVVCLVSRAVHLEILINMEASTFMNAYRRFQAIRGCARFIRSDRGTNFISIRNRAEPTHIQKAIEELQKPQGNWRLHPPYASHFAGSWERKIGSVRAVLKGALECLHKRNLSRDEFSTYIAEASAIVNNTPLCDISQRPEDPMPISPAQLLTLKGSPNPPPLEKFSKSDLDNYGKTRWRRVQHLSEEFWRRWRLEYVATLQDRLKWTTKKRNLSEGDVVLVKEKNVPRNTWPLAKVIAVRLSDDGLVRSVALQLPPLPGKRASRTTTRCIHDLVLIQRNKADNIVNST